MPVAAGMPGVAGPRSYLVAAQNADGGFGGLPGASSSPLFTDWAAMGLAAAGADLAGVRAPGGASLTDALAAERPATATEAERSALALAAAGLTVPPATLALIAAAQRADGSIGGQLVPTAFGILALRAACRPGRSPVVAAATRWLLDRQQSDGAFAGTSGRSGIDETAAAVEAVAAVDKHGHRAAIAAALRFLVRRQRPDGGFGLTPGAPSNAQSTAWAVQAFVAGGRDPGAVRRRGARSPLAYLRSLTDSTGAVRYSRTGRQTPVWVTAQALAALARRALPVRARPC